MSATSRTENVLAVSDNGAIGAEHFLGYFFWHSLPGQHKPLVTIRKNWKAVDLPEERLPRNRQPVDVAQEAVRSVEGDITDEDGPKRRVIVGEVSESSADFIWQVTLQIWAKEERIIEHEKSMRVTFDKKQSTFDFEHLEGYVPDLDGLETAIQEHFEAHTSRVSGNAMRQIVRHLLEDLAQAENMSESGKSAVYWSPAEHGDVLKSVAEFLSKTYTGGGLYSRGALHMVPVINDEGQREFLKRRFVENCEEDLQEFRDRLLDLVRTQDTRKQGFRSDLIFNLQQQRQDLIERRERFEALLNDELQELNQSSQLADKALAKLLTEAQVPA